MVLVLAAVCVLTIDVGMVFCTQARLQNAADAGSLAAVLELMQQRKAGCSEDEARGHAVTEAGEIAGANTPGAAVVVNFGRLNGDGEFVEQDTGVQATAVRVAVARDETAQAGSVGLFFAPLVGVREKDLHAVAVARASRSIKRVSGVLRPLAIYKGDIPPVSPARETMVVYDYGKLELGCFGLVDFDGGANRTRDLEDWILHGYQGSFGIDPDTGYTIVEGYPGFRTGLEDEFQQIIGQQFLVCVYDQITGRGANAEFRIVSFLGITLTDVQLGGKDRYIEARVEYLANIHDADVGDVGESHNLCKVQLVL